MPPYVPDQADKSRILASVQTKSAFLKVESCLNHDTFCKKSDQGVTQILSASCS